LPRPAGDGRRRGQRAQGGQRNPARSGHEPAGGAGEDGSLNGGGTSARLEDVLDMSEEEQACRFRQRGLCGHRHSLLQHARLSSRLGAVVVALAVAGCTAASAQTYENETGASVRFYGQVSPVWQRFDDGDKTTSNLVDNANSNTRMGLVIARPIGDNSLDADLRNGPRRAPDQRSVAGRAPDLDRLAAHRSAQVRRGLFGPLRHAPRRSGQHGDGWSGDARRLGHHAGRYRHLRRLGWELRFPGQGRRAHGHHDWSGIQEFRRRTAVAFALRHTVVVRVQRRRLLWPNVLAEDDRTDYYDMALRWTGTAGDFDLAAAAGFAWAEPESGDTAKTYMGSATVLHTPIPSL
jgi:hypothetical protein